MSMSEGADSVGLHARWVSAPKPIRWAGAFLALWLTSIVLIGIAGVALAPASHVFPAECPADSINCTRIAENPHRGQGLREVSFNASIQDVRAAAVAWVEDQPRTSIQLDDGSEFHAVFRTAFVFYPDDFFLQTYCTEEGSALRVHSESRLGVGDMGVNDVRVAALVDHMQSLEFEPVDECVPVPVS